MALQKEIELENGVVLKYHRITSINKITNISNNIEISSYTNENQRTKEKKYQETQIKNINGEELTEQEQELLDTGIDIFVNSDFLQLPYDEEMTIEDAYDYLKTTEKYKKGKDV